MKITISFDDGNIAISRDGDLTCPPIDIGAWLISNAYAIFVTTSCDSTREKVVDNIAKILSNISVGRVAEDYFGRVGSLLAQIQISQELSNIAKELDNLKNGGGSAPVPPVSTTFSIN